MDLLKQNDKRWKDYLIVPENKNTSIGRIGCLATTLTNVYRLYHNNPDYTVLDFVKAMQKANGFTKQGAVKWAPLQRLFNCKHYFSRQHPFSIVKHIFWIIQVPFQDTGHFCLVWSAKGDVIKYHDPYKDTFETINYKDAISVREIFFNIGG